MTIDEAIEGNVKAMQILEGYALTEEADAVQLGIEALELVQQFKRMRLPHRLKKSNDEVIFIRLPSETEGE